MKYIIGAAITGSAVLGETEANSPEEAMERASQNFGDPSLCHQCSERVSDLEVDTLWAQDESGDCTSEPNTHDQLIEAAKEVERLRAALTKINGIRNSIVGAQTVNWSEHIYPLASALNDAGFAGESYEVARENLRTLLERATKAEAEVERLSQVVRSAAEQGET